MLLVPLLGVVVLGYLIDALIPTLILLGVVMLGLWLSVRFREYSKTLMNFWAWVSVICIFFLVTIFIIKGVTYNYI